MDEDCEVQSAQELVEGAIKALVEHYRDPIHEEAVDESSDGECPARVSSAGPVEETRPIPPVVAFQLQRLLEFSSLDVATAPRRILEVWRHLVDSYATHVRPTLFGNAGRPTSPLVAVVTHYQLLTSLYFERHKDVLLDAGATTSSAACIPSTLEHEGGDNMLDDDVLDAEEGDQVNALERLACDVTLATAIEIRRKNNNRSRQLRQRQSSAGMDDEGNGSDKPEGNANAAADDDDEAVDRAATIRILTALIRHMTSVWRVVVAAHQRQSAQRFTASTTTTRTVVRHVRLQSTLDRVALRCATSLLSFDWDPASVLGIDSSYDSKSDAAVQSAAPPDTLHCLPMTLAPKGQDAFHHLSIRNEIDWNSLLELKGSFWAPPRDNHRGGAPTELSNAVQDFWHCWSEYDASPSMTRADDGTGWDRDHLREIFRRWDSETLAKAVRAHFFGRDMVVDPTSDMVSQYQTRLHLGKTVRYVPDPDVTQKPHLQVPSRVTTALQWMSMLDPEHLTESVWVELLPILYELLSGASYVLNGWGAVAVYQLVSLHDNTDDSFLVSEQSESSIQNLLLMLHTIAKTCREGPVLAVAGKAYCKLLRLLGKRRPSEASQQRRAASQHWLTVLYQNQTRASTHASLILGLLTGATQVLHDQVECNGAHAADGLEVGRLGLSALLPLLVNDDAFLGLETGQKMSIRNTRDAMRLAALVALNNLMIAAYPIVPRHTGKILSHLLRACAELQPSSNAGIGDGIGEIVTPLPLRVNEGKLFQRVALHVTSTALVLCGEKGDEFLESLESDRESYSNDFLKVVEDVRECARALRPAAKSIEAPHVLIQVL